MNGAFLKVPRSSTPRLSVGSFRFKTLYCSPRSTKMGFRMRDAKNVAVTEAAPARRVVEGGAASPFGQKRHEHL